MSTRPQPQRRPALKARFAIAIGLGLTLGGLGGVPVHAQGEPTGWSCKPQPMAPGDTTPPCGFASDDWVRGGGGNGSGNGSGSWAAEQARRQELLDSYLKDRNPADAARYHFRSAPETHTPALAWNWFTSQPIGFGGMPHVLLQTLLSLNPAELKPDSNADDKLLMPLAMIWYKPSPVPAEARQGKYTLDHLGFGPNPEDYTQGVARPPQERSHPLPNGLVHDTERQGYEAAPAGGLIDPDAKLRALKSAGIVAVGVSKIGTKIKDFDNQLLAGIRRMGGEHAVDYGVARKTLQQPPAWDATFFACSACHQGRVLVGGSLDAAGNTVKPGKMVFLPGMPNTEVEAQYYSKLLMETGYALLASGSSLDATALPKKSSDLKPDTARVMALYRRMIERALDPKAVETIYGRTYAQVRHAKQQTALVAANFAPVLADVIGTAVKTQYIYKQVAAGKAYNPNNPSKAAGQALPDVLADRLGQMDAFGIASGLVAIHAQRPNNTYLQFLCEDSQGKNPIFGILKSRPGPGCDKKELDKAKAQILATLRDWTPPVPAPIDIPSLAWTGHRVLANWDGNQGAAARTLASGTSATGDPLKVNVRIHEPLNPFINNLPPPPYPYAIDREKAQRGMAIFFDRKNEYLKPSERCSECHQPRSSEIFPVSHLGVDPNRSLLNTEVSRYGLAGLVMEACRIFIANNPGNDWCLPHDDQGQVIKDWTKANDDYFKDTPGRVRAGANGYKADMQHGIWARAPYLHNGSVPTLAQLICPSARPAKFLRGVLYYDEAMVGFEWATRPQDRYSPYDVQLVKEYDTSVFGRSNKGHEFGSSLCPSLDGLDPVKDRAQIAERIRQSKAGDLLEYMKTF